MPGLQHQMIVQILRDEPQLVAILLGNIGFKTPSGSYPIIADSDLSHRGPRLLKELRADNLFLFPGMYEKIAVVVEVQTTPPDNERFLNWPCYVTSARAVHDCKAYMMVIATSQAASRGSESLIDIGQPGFGFLPFVVGGHGRLPAPGGLVFGPELTMLNVLTGRLKLSTHDARMFALSSIAPADPDRRLNYVNTIRQCTTKRIREALEELMKTYFKDDFIDGYIKQGIEQGIGQGEERALLAVLKARGFTVRKQVKSLISACTDPDQLELWISRAVTATTIDEVFA
jgi:hypothetical protein